MQVLSFSGIGGASGSRLIISYGSYMTHRVTGVCQAGVLSWIFVALHN
jgi:hypothetical protein